MEGEPAPKLALRTKFMLLFTIALGVSLLFHLLYVIPFIQNHEVQREKAHQEEIARNIVRILDVDLMRIKSRMLRIAKYPEFRNMDFAAQKRTMLRHVEVSKFVASISVMNADGRLVCGTMEDFDTTKSYADSPCFSIPFEQGKVYFAPPRFHSKTMLVTASICVPIESETGKRIGVLIGEMRLNGPINYVKNYPLEEHHVAILVNSRGTVIAHSRKDLFAMKAGPLSLDYSRWPCVKAIMEGSKAGSGEFEHEQESYFASYAVPEANSWGVVIRAPMHAIIAKSKALSWQLMSANIGLFTIALVFSLVFTHRIVGERDRAEKRTRHLNLVLLAIRNVNQLITREKDRQRLIQSACNNLTETRGYHNAWIIIVGESGRFITSAESGMGKDFPLMLERLKDGQLPDCVRKALNQPGTVVIKDPPVTCRNCLLPHTCTDRGVMAIRLEHGGRVYGLLSASIPRSLIGEEQEQLLFREVALDIAFALHDIELGKDHKRAVEALRESEAKYRHLFENLNDAAFLADTETGLILETNLGGETLLGRSNDEIVGMHQTKLHPPDKADEYRRKFAEHIGRGHAIDHDTEVIKKDGTVVPVTISASTLTIGERHLILGLFRDITERKQAEAELMQAEKLATVGTMIAGVAHELNNPIGTIMGIAQLLQEQEKTLSAQGRQGFKNIQEAAKQCQYIVRNLTSFATRKKAKKKITDIAAVLRRSTDLMQPVLKTSLVEVEEDYPSEPVFAEAAPQEIEQVFVNIIKNAAEAMQQTEGQSVLQIRAKTAKGKMKIEFEDNGPGLAEPARIFDPFYTTKEPGKGTGLGLSVSHRIITDHGGTISAINTGHGAMFRVTLPCKQQKDGGAADD